VQAEPPRQLGDTGLALRFAESEEEGGRPIDRSDGISVKDHRSVAPVFRVTGAGRPTGSV
jgi:hypothetical protein